MLLNAILWLHTGVAALAALLLLIGPAWLHRVATGVPLDPNAPLASAVISYVRFLCLGPLAVAVVASFARQSASVRVRSAGALSLLALSLATAGLALGAALPRVRWPLASVALAFAGAYGFVLLFRRSDL